MKSNFRKCFATGILCAGLLLAAGIPASAKNSRTVTLQYGAVFHGTSLPAGRYNIKWQTHSPEATVEFLQHHQVVVSAEGKVERRDRTYERDAIVYGAGSDGSMSVLEIRFADSNKVLVFNQ
jgi:hypothetical protein